MTKRFSIVHDLPKSRWGASHMPNKVPVGWKGTLKTIRMMWEAGEDTILETAFYELFDKSIKFPHLPRFMQK
jgi:hypothetical protein